MAFDFNERINSVSPSVAKIALDRGDSQRTYNLDISDASDLLDASRTILGYTNYSPANMGGRLTRIPPLADPAYPMMFADSIPKLQGVGRPEQTAANPSIEVDTVPDFALYPTFDFTVNFSQKQYSVFTDDKINILDGNWTKPDGSTVQYYQYPQEWTRYTECFPVKPDGNYLTQQGSTIAGSMVFMGGAADGKSCAFMPSVRVPNFYVSLLWRQIPLRYITSTNSYIMNHGFQNTVNQNPIQLPFNGIEDFCAPGSLLYVDFSYVPYSPPTGFETNIYGNGDASQKLVDVTLNFVWTTRTTYDDPVDTGNDNYIGGGHNLLYWHGDLNAHYCVIQKGSSPFRPTYLSSPLELLQADPDAPGAI